MPCKFLANLDKTFLKDSVCHLSVTAASACFRYFRGTEVVLSLWGQLSARSNQKRNDWRWRHRKLGHYNRTFFPLIFQFMDHLLTSALCLTCYWLDCNISAAASAASQFFVLRYRALGLSWLVNRICKHLLFGEDVFQDIFKIFQAIFLLHAP